MTRTGEAGRPQVEEPTETFFDWVNLHTRELAIALVVLAVGATGYALYARSQTIRSQRAERAYFEAQRSVVAGNLPLAQTDLDKMIKRYGGTGPAARGSLSLAQVLFDQGKHQEGIKVLEDAKNSSGSKPYRAAIEALLAAGYEGLGKFAEAADHYTNASQSADFQADKDTFLASAARAYMSGGNKEKAKELWTKLATDALTATSAEAHIRLGELEAKPADKS
jgi:predicted negative regulator of RcsB-dependent stress response